MLSFSSPLQTPAPHWWLVRWRPKILQRGGSSLQDCPPEGQVLPCALSSSCPPVLELWSSAGGLGLTCVLWIWTFVMFSLWASAGFMWDGFPGVTSHDGPPTPASWKHLCPFFRPSVAVAMSADHAEKVASSSSSSSSSETTISSRADLKTDRRQQTNTPDKYAGKRSHLTVCVRWFVLKFKMILVLKIWRHLTVCIHKPKLPGIRHMIHWLHVFTSPLLLFSPLVSSPPLFSPLSDLFHQQDTAATLFILVLLLTQSLCDSLACSCNCKHHILQGADSWECDLYWMDLDWMDRCSAEVLVCESSVANLFS